MTQIFEQALGLSHEERVFLAHEVLLSLEPEVPGVGEAWNEELIRRVAQIESDEVVGIPAAQVLEELRRKLL